MTWAWTEVEGNVYAVTFDGDEVGLITLSSTVRHHRLRLVEMVEGFARVDRLAGQVEALTADDEAGGALRSPRP